MTIPIEYNSTEARRKAREAIDETFRIMFAPMNFEEQMAWDKWRKTRSKTALRRANKITAEVNAARVDKCRRARITAANPHNIFGLKDWP